MGNKYLVKKVMYYIIQSIFPTVMLWGIAVLYRYIICNFSESSDDADFICDLNWKDGFILTCCYSIIKLFISPILEFNSVLSRVIATIVLYIISYAVIAFPFLLASFFQPFLLNVFFHCLIIITAIEILFLRTGSCFTNRNTAPSES